MICANAKKRIKYPPINPIMHDADHTRMRSGDHRLVATTAPIRGLVPTRPTAIIHPPPRTPPLQLTSHTPIPIRNAYYVYLAEFCGQSYLPPVVKFCSFRIGVYCLFPNTYYSVVSPLYFGSVLVTSFTILSANAGCTVMLHHSATLIPISSPPHPRLHQPAPPLHPAPQRQIPRLIKPRTHPRCQHTQEIPNR